MRDCQSEFFHIAWTGYKTGISSDYLVKRNYIEMIYYTILLPMNETFFERTVSSLHYCLLQEEKSGQKVQGWVKEFVCEFVCLSHTI